jgi:hypothetical protein
MKIYDDRSLDENIVKISRRVALPNAIVSKNIHIKFYETFQKDVLR